LFQACRPAPGEEAVYHVPVCTMTQAASKCCCGWCMSWWYGIYYYQKAAVSSFYFFYNLFVMIPHHPGGPSSESSDAQNMKESHDYLLWRTVGPGVITECTYASLTPNREKQMQVLKHTTQSHKRSNSTLLNTIKCMGSSKWTSALLLRRCKQLNI